MLQGRRKTVSVGVIVVELNQDLVKCLHSMQIPGRELYGQVQAYAKIRDFQPNGQHPLFLAYVYLDRLMFVWIINQHTFRPNGDS